jgi:NTP pyrophosphatase (non-canonical NTP hydrolase)
MGLQWIPHCHALVRMPGESEGADDEVMEAERLGIPVFHSMRELEEWLEAIVITDTKRPSTPAKSLNDYKGQVRELTDAKGFSSDKDRVWEMLALIHTEISEATDAYKKGMHLDKIGEELADTIIRIFHLCSALDIDIEQAYRIKMAINWERPHKYNTVRGG